MLRVVVNHRQVDLAIDRIKSSIEQRRQLMHTIGTRIVAYTRQTIHMQGRGKAWKSLAPSTVKSTGRDKALTSLIPFIKHRVNARSGVTIYFSRRPKGWTIDMHERGFRSSPVSKGVIMKAKRLGVFSGRKASVIPARKIFPNKGEVTIIASGIVQDWISGTVGRTWR